MPAIDRSTEHEKMKQKKKTQKRGAQAARIHDLPPRDDPKGGIHLIVPAVQSGGSVAAGDVNNDGASLSPMPGKISR